MPSFAHVVYYEDYRRSAVFDPLRGVPNFGDFCGWASGGAAVIRYFGRVLLCMDAPGWGLDRSV